MKQHVAALFVERDGSYSDYRDGVDMYDVERDARTYRGRLPVVAHPPCNRWCLFAKTNYTKTGNEDYRPGNDGGMFKFALRSVNRCGGVLEHPGHSLAWKAFKLKKPPKRGWAKSGKGYVCQLYQSKYGHKAAKCTWLYYRGINAPFELRWGRMKGTHQVGGGAKYSRSKPRVSKEEAIATPPAFRDDLIRLAIRSQSLKYKCNKLLSM